MIFPEGTRSKSGELLPFKDGAFRLALEVEADILPVAVAGSRKALEKGSWRFGRALGLVSVGEPIPSAGKSTEELKQQARRSVEKQYKELQKKLGTQPGESP